MEKSNFHHRYSHAKPVRDCHRGRWRREVRQLRVPIKPRLWRKNGHDVNMYKIVKDDM